VQNQLPSFSVSHRSTSGIAETENVGSRDPLTLLGRMEDSTAGTYEESILSFDTARFLINFEPRMMTHSTPEDDLIEEDIDEKPVTT
jgi:hypothetical protein